VRNPRDRPHERVEPERAAGQLTDHHDGPFVADPVDHAAERAAFDDIAGLIHVVLQYLIGEARTFSCVLAATLSS
jgi:hypothetical protein